MSARSTFPSSLPIAWPLAGSVLATTAIVAFVCTPPPSQLHSWTQIFSRATLYLMVACAVHVLAVWGVCRVREESAGSGLPLVWAVIWTAWIAVVWLPLVAVLTAEHSPWVAMVLPMTVVFATMVLKWQAAPTPGGDELDEPYALPSAPFQSLQSPPLWTMLLPAAITALTAEAGISLFVAGHDWQAGSLFGVALIYPVGNWLGRRQSIDGRPRVQRWARTSAGNSITVWLLLVLALIPVMAGYTAGRVAGLLGLKARTGPVFMPPAISRRVSDGYDSLILYQPKKPHVLSPPPSPEAASGSFKDTHVIPFDGAYWYFKQPDTRPAPGARVMLGNPVKKRVYSTDHLPLVMEAHQPLGQEVAFSCCRSLRIDVRNADNVPGAISIEVLLRNTLSAKRQPPVSLGTEVLITSTVHPMPLQRPPVDDKLVFQLPHAARGKAFNEITIRIKPDVSRAMAGAQVGIKDFVLQP